MDITKLFYSFFMILQSFNPIGGVRIANITTGNLEIGIKVRNKLLELIKKKHI